MNDINMVVLTSTVSEENKTTCSIFSEVKYSLEDYNGLFISDRQDALNFRYRVSKQGYFSSWHVAGDPTLIVIRSGTLRLTLRSGEFRDFSSGDMFIAQDFLQKGEAFDQKLHGHTAELIGEQVLQALHIKLAQRVHCVTC